MYKDYKQQRPIDIVIDVKNYEMTCGGCPTIYKFKDEDADDYTFHLRHGYAYLEYEGRQEHLDFKFLASGKMNGFDGVCNFKDFTRWAREKGIQINC